MLKLDDFTNAAQMMVDSELLVCYGELVDVVLINNLNPEVFVATIL